VINLYVRALPGVRFRLPDARLVVPYAALSLVVGTGTTGSADGPRWHHLIFGLAPELGVELRPSRSFFARASVRLDSILAHSTGSCDMGDALPGACSPAEDPSTFELFFGLGIGFRA